MSDTQIPQTAAQLIQGAMAGDQTLFTQLYELYMTPVYRYLFVRTRDKALAEDLTQVVFLKAFEHQSALSASGSKPLAYLYTTARNALIDYWKKKKEVHQSDASDSFEKAPDEKRTPDKLVEQSDLVRELVGGLSQLTEEQREVISLKYFHDYSAAEIAKQIGKSEEAVRQLQCRGLKALRDVMK